MLRTTRALGEALVALVQERHFDDISVQQILDRAGVGRTAFYAHYRNKEDVLHSSYERLFLAFERWVEQPSPTGFRLFPVTELLAHVGEVQALTASLERAGRLEEAFALCRGHAARLIERRLARLAPPPRMPPALLARMLAGALVEAIEWWLGHRDRATPVQVDLAFHCLARGLAGTR